MIALLIVLGIVLLLLLLLALRIRVVIEGTESIQLTLRILFLKILLYPKRITPKGLLKSQRKADRKEAKALKRKRKKKQQEPRPAKKRPKNPLRMIRMIIRIVSRLSIHFRKYFRLRLHRIVVRVGSSDAARTAIEYGAFSAAIAYLVTLLEQFITIRTPKDSRLEVSPDYLSEHVTYDIKIEFSASLRSILALAIRALFAFFKAKRSEQTKVKAKRTANKPPLETNKQTM